MYWLTFRVRITTALQYGRNGTAHAAGASIFSERELTFTFAICCRSSVCRLSVCLSVIGNARAPYSAIFGNISMALGTLAIR